MVLRAAIRLREVKRRGFMGCFFWAARWVTVVAAMVLALGLLDA
jgi:hypothetical protein